MRIQGGARGRRVAAGGSAVGAALAALLVVGTLGGSGGASVDEQDPGTADLAADAALAAALAVWEAFPADARTRPFVVLDAVSGPDGWRSGAAAAKFAAGNWAAPADLPAAPAKYRGYAVVPAADALRVLRTAEMKGAVKKGSIKKLGSPLKVSDIRLATAPVATDRGVVRLPVWRVSFDAAKGAFRIPAVASPARYAAGDAVEGPAATVARDGRTLTLGSAGEATCAAAEVAESAQAVAVRLADAGCATAVLAATLGNRVLLGVDGDGTVRGPLAVTPAKG